MGIHPDRWGFLPGFLLESTRVQTGNYTDKTSKKPFFQPGKFCKHSVWTSKRKLLGEPKPLVTWLEEKRTTSKAIRQKGKCDDE